jgi:uncharacterized membrane protein
MPAKTRKTNTTGKTNTLAIVGLILSFLVPIVGLVLGIIALNQLKNNPGEEGRGLAIAAIVISSIFMLIGILIFIGAMAFTSSMFAP